MLHACFYTICLVFRYTSWHFYAFSGTNLLMRCHNASSLFSAVLCFRKVTQEIFSELDETKDEHPEIYQSFQRTEEETERGHRAARPAPGPRPLVVRPPWPTSGAAPSPIKTPDGKNLYTRSLFQNTSRSTAVVDPRLGGSRRSSQHPVGEGNCHRRSSSSPCLPPARWVSSLPWTMDP
jgi:hypothetical protein